VILDPEKNMRFMKEFYTMFSRNDLALGETLNFFTTRHQWTIRRNAFLSLFVPVVTGLMESGIYSRWEYYSEALKTYWNLSLARKKLFHIILFYTISLFEILS